MNMRHLTWSSSSSCWSSAGGGSILDEEICGNPSPALRMMMLRATQHIRRSPHRTTNGDSRCRGREAWRASGSTTCSPCAKSDPKAREPAANWVRVVGQLEAAAAGAADAAACAERSCSRFMKPVRHRFTARRRCAQAIPPPAPAPACQHSAKSDSEPGDTAQRGGAAAQRCPKYRGVGEIARIVQVAHLECRALVLRVAMHPRHAGQASVDVLQLLAVAARGVRHKADRNNVQREVSVRKLPGYRVMGGMLVSTQDRAPASKNQNQSERT